MKPALTLDLYLSLIGRLYTSALREEAELDRRNEHYARAQRLVNLASKLDWLSQKLSVG